jgi:hypothetical protein
MFDFKLQVNQRGLLVLDQFFEVRETLGGLVPLLLQLGQVVPNPAGLGENAGAAGNLDLGVLAQHIALRGWYENLPRSYVIPGPVYPASATSNST